MAQLRIRAPSGTSLKSLVRGYLLTHQTEGRSPYTVAYYKGISSRFLWYVEQQGWADGARILTEWQINGSESSSRRASPRTIHHYYRALTAFFKVAFFNSPFEETSQ
jgi:hypothetical protein